MKGIRTTLVLLLTTLALSGCQTSGKDGSLNESRLEQVLGELGVVLGEPVNTISNFRLSGWREVDSRHLVVTAGRHQHYLIRLITPCINLPYALSIAFDTPNALISHNDAVLVMSLHRRLERCPIQTIFRLNDTDEANPE